MRSLRSELRARGLVVALALVAAPAAARGDEPSAAGASVAEARVEFTRGAEHVSRSEWPEALAAFERSSTLRVHAATTFNVGICQRAMGQYTRARQTLRDALARDAAAGGAELPEPTRAQLRAFLGEIDGLLVRLDVTLEPLGAAIAVDGRPLVVLDASATPPIAAAGLREPGPGEPWSRPSFRLELDPGAHVVTLARAGYTNAVVRKSYAPGAREKVALVLSMLPATLHVDASQPGAIVAVDGFDVGVTPLEVSRPGGAHSVVVRKKGFVTYETRVDVRPGEEISVSAPLPVPRPALHERWWFWAAAGTVVAGAAVATYFAARPAPERPALYSGGLGWNVDLR